MEDTSSDEDDGPVSPVLVRLPPPPRPPPPRSPPPRPPAKKTKKKEDGETARCQLHFSSSPPLHSVVLLPGPVDDLVASSSVPVSGDDDAMDTAAESGQRQARQHPFLEEHQDRRVPLPLFLRLYRRRLRLQSQGGKPVVFDMRGKTVAVRDDPMVVSRPDAVLATQQLRLLCLSLARRSPIVTGGCARATEEDEENETPERCTFKHGVAKWIGDRQPSRRKKTALELLSDSDDEGVAESLTSRKRSRAEPSNARKILCVQDDDADLKAANLDRIVARIADRQGLPMLPPSRLPSFSSSQILSSVAPTDASSQSSIASIADVQLLPSPPRPGYVETQPQEPQEQPQQRLITSFLQTRPSPASGRTVPEPRKLTHALFFTSEASTTTATTHPLDWQGISRSGRATLLLAAPNEKPQPGEIVSLASMLVVGPIRPEDLERISRWCESQVLALSAEEDLAFRANLFAAILSMLESDTCRRLRASSVWSWVVTRWQIIDCLFRLSCVPNPLLSHGELGSAFADCAIAVQIERLLLDLFELLWPYSKASGDVHGLDFALAVRLDREEVFMGLDLMMALAQLCDSFGLRKMSSGSPTGIDDDVVSFWHVFNKAASTWIQRASMAGKKLADVTSGEIAQTEFVWDLLFQTTRLYKCDLARGLLSPGAELALPNWLLVETLLRESHVLLTETTRTNTTASSLKGSLPREIFTRLGQLSMQWSSMPWPALITQLLSIWKGRQFDDLPGDSAQFPPLLQLCPVGSGWSGGSPAAFNAQDRWVSCYHIFLWLLCYHYSATYHELLAHPVQPSKTLRQQLSALNRAIPGRLKVDTVAAVRNVTSLVVLVAGLTGSFGQTVRQITNIVDFANDASDLADVSRGVILEAVLYTCRFTQLFQQQHTFAEPFEMLKSLLVPVISSYNDNERQSSLDWAIEKRAMWKLVQNKRLQTIVVATSWIRYLVLHESRHLETLLNCGWLSLLSVDCRVPAEARKGALDVLHAFLVGSETLRIVPSGPQLTDSTTAGRDSQELLMDDIDFGAIDLDALAGGTAGAGGGAAAQTTPVLFARAQLAKAMASMQVFLSCLNLVNARLHISQQRLNGKLAGAPTAYFGPGSAAAAAAAGPASASTTAATQSSPTEQYCIDDASLDLAVELMAYCAVLLVSERPTQTAVCTWEYYVERFGLTSTYCLSSRSSDDRRVGVRFFSIVSYRVPAFVRTNELLCWRLWFLSHLDHTVTAAQPLLSIAISTRLPVQWMPVALIPEHTAAYSDLRLLYLHEFVDHLARSHKAAPVTQQRDVRAKCASMLGGMHMMLHLCLQEAELIGGEFYRHYVDFVLDTIAYVVYVCADILHDREEPTSLLQQLLDRFVLSGTATSSSSTRAFTNALSSRLGLIVRSLGRFDLARDAYIQRALRQIVERYLQPSQAAAAAAAEDPARVADLVDALVPQSSSDLRPAHKLRVHILRMHTRRYLTAFGKGNRNDLVYLSAFAMRLVVSLVQKMYTVLPLPYKGSAQELDLWCEHFDEDIRVLVQPLLETYALCTNNSAHLQLRNLFFQVAQTIVHADASVTRAVVARSSASILLVQNNLCHLFTLCALQLSVDRVSRTIVSQLDVNTLPTMAIFYLNSLKQLHKTLPAIEATRAELSRLVGDDPDFAMFESQLAFAVVVVAPAPAPSAAAVTAASNHIFAFWRTILLSRATLSNQTRHQQLVWDLLNHFCGVLTNCPPGGAPEAHMRQIEQEVIAHLPPDDVRPLFPSDALLF